MKFKSIVCILLVAVLMLSLAACGKKPIETTPNDNQNGVEVATQPTTPPANDTNVPMDPGSFSDILKTYWRISYDYNDPENAKEYILESKEVDGKIIPVANWWFDLDTIYDSITSTTSYWAPIYEFNKEGDGSDGVYILYGFNANTGAVFKMSVSEVPEKVEGIREFVWELTLPGDKMEVWTQSEIADCIKGIVPSPIAGPLIYDNNNVAADGSASYDKYFITGNVGSVHARRNIRTEGNMLALNITVTVLNWEETQNV